MSTFAGLEPRIRSPATGSGWFIGPCVRPVAKNLQNISFISKESIQ